VPKYNQATRGFETQIQGKLFTLKIVHRLGAETALSG